MKSDPIRLSADGTMATNSSQLMAGGTAGVSPLLCLCRGGSQADQAPGSEAGAKDGPGMSGGGGGAYVRGGVGLPAYSSLQGAAVHEMPQAVVEVSAMLSASTCCQAIQ